VLDKKIFLINDVIQFSMWTNPRVQDSPDHLANNVQGVIDIHMQAAIFWGAGTMLVAVYGLTGMLATVFGCAKPMLNAVYGHSGMLAANFWGAGTMLVALYVLTGMLATVFGCAKTMLNAVYGHSGMLLTVFGCAGTMLVAVYGLTGMLSAVFGRAGIMPHSDWNCNRSCRNQLQQKLQESQEHYYLSKYGHRPTTRYDGPTHNKM